MTVFGPTVALHGQKEIHLHKDFNQDGRKDSLGCTYDGGSGFGGMYCTLRNGRTKEVYTLDMYSCFCRIKKTIAIPPPLLLKENDGFLEAMTKNLFSEVRTAPDPSLQWILSASFSRKTLAHHRYFDLVFNGSNDWLPLPCLLPEPYALRIGPDTLSRIYTTDTEMPEWYDSLTTQGYLAYGGLTQGMDHSLLHMSVTSAHLVDSNENYRVWAVAHGIYVQRGSEYKWLFITDADINYAPDKLRWSSIRSAQLIGDMVIIVQQLPAGSGLQVYLADIETGICGHFREGLWLSAGDMPAGRLVNPSDGIFRLRHEGTTLSVSTEEIRNALLSAK